ncbi:MAG: type II toxin-antitoxin system HicB family antitoxin [Anaerolineae bacterium]|nr:type II toxin-antitoxin system HicB family antitoxin [Anaerolineae bacterium]
MRFPVVIHKDPESDYGVSVPDLPGCFSAGETVDQALTAVVEAIEAHVEGMLLDSEPIPTPKTIEFYKDEPDFASGIWAIVSVDISKLSGRSKRVNVTIPERLLYLMDQFAAERGETRSGLIAQATIEYLAMHNQ